jgi:hypothetical protein
MAQRFDIHTTDFGWNRVPPLVRLLAWLALVALIMGLAQLVVWAGDGGVSMLSSKGRTVGLLAALGTAGFIMSRAHRSLAAYGLAVSEYWLVHLLIGLALGLVVTLGAAGLALVSGAAIINPLFEYEGLLAALAEALPALPISAVCTVLLAGFVAGELRLRHGPPATALFAGVIAAAAFTTTMLSEGLEPSEQRAVVTVALAGVALVSLRQMTGDVILPLGALIAALAVERFTRKAVLLDVGPNEAATVLFAPLGDPRGAPALWVMLLVAAVAAQIKRARRPPEPAAQRKTRQLSRSFKRIYPMGTMGALATLDVWLPQLRRARWRVGLPYVPRLIATLVLSTINTVLSAPERFIRARRLRGVEVKPPLFIVGAHRSGTTHLQNLLALDPQFVTPRAHQVMNPWGFKFSGLLLWPLLIVGTPWKRPMDAVRFGLSSANEEEYAIANLCGLSPDWSIRLPQQWNHYERYADPRQFSPQERERWKAVLLGFLQRLVARSGRRPLLKNPYNTGRVSLLRELFPGAGAQFVHIHRHPFDTYRSNLHMQAEAHCLFELQEGPDRDAFAAWFLRSYRAAEERFYDDTAELPAEQVVEVRFEDLERDALGQVKRIYAALGLDYTDAFDAALRDYLAGLGAYRKNVHKPLPDAERDAVLDAMAPLMTRWGYDAERATAHHDAPALATTT